MEVRRCVVCSSILVGQQQKYCSNKCKQKHHYYRLKEQTNTYHSQTLRALSRKLELVEMMGGKCTRCGYNSNLSALHFHHLKAYQKAFKLDMRTLSNRRWSVIVEEVEKCELVYANFHAEEHNPELSVEKVRRITNGASHRKR